MVMDPFNACMMLPYKKRTFDHDCFNLSRPTLNKAFHNGVNHDLDDLALNRDCSFNQNFSNKILFSSLS